MGITGIHLVSELHLIVQVSYNLTLEAWLQVGQPSSLLPYPRVLPQAIPVLSKLELGRASSKAFPAILIPCNRPESITSSALFMPTTEPEIGYILFRLPLRNRTLILRHPLMPR